MTRTTRPRRSATDRLGTVRPAGPGPQASTGFWLHQAALAWQRELGRRLSPLGLTPTQFMVLSCAGWLQATTGDPPTQQQVADLAGTDRMMTSKVLTGLADQGLVERRPDPGDARSRRIHQTAAGREVTRAALGHVQSLETELLRPGGIDPVSLREALAAIAVASG